MSTKEEALRSARKREIIQTQLDKLMQSNPELYYLSTVDIAREIHDALKMTFNRLPIEDQVLMKKLSVRDIQIILSIV